MNKNAARQLVKETLQNSFNKERFVYFIKNLLNTIDESKAFHAHGYIQEKYKQQAGIIKTYERIGTYTDADGKKIDILIVYLEKEKSIDKARTTLRNFVSDYLKQRDRKDAGLVAFVSPNLEDWRFSFIKMEYKLSETSGGKIKAEEEFTPARRYSFLVGTHENSHTAQSRLVPILEDDVSNPTLKQLEESFNIEKVTKEFFEKYHELFLKVKENLDEIILKDKRIRDDFKNKEINKIDFAKKLLGQVVFLYFLQKKGWFGVKRDKEWGLGSKQFLRELFDKKHSDYKNFFNDILEPLFYEALRLERPGDYYSRFDCRIPFLNGGLFDPINNYDWINIEIDLPNELFSNTFRTKEEDIGTGILDVFDRYNFTVKEDEPLEKEVAIDPEMLGKVFENLLEVKDRKSKGTYYTPREIVHYMCQESLINYLAIELEDKKVSKKDIETLIKYGETTIEHDATYIEKKSKKEKTKVYSKAKLPKSIEKNAKLIDEKLTTIRVCDPAVGSGAFLVGMMNEIIRARNALTPYFKNKRDRMIYNFKRHAIQNCLYGVDIDPGAVEIAKLRLWLSLVVDEEDIKQIKPLPNLDYKIMQGNSLIELLSGEFLVTSIDQTRAELVNKLKKSKDELFNIASPSQKEQKRQEINELIRKIFEYDRNLIIDDLRQKIKGIQNQGRLFTDAKFEIEDKKRIEELEDRIEEVQKIKIPGPSEHFEWHINFSEVFQEKDGFDVVIANPPYEEISGKLGKEIYQKHYSPVLSGHYDLYIFFFKRAFDIANNNGLISFITSHTYIHYPQFVNLRKYIFENGHILEITNRISGIFESAVVDNALILIQKDNIENNQTTVFSSKKEELNKLVNEEAIILKRSEFNFSNFDLKAIKNRKVLSKFIKDTNPLGDITESSQGITVYAKVQVTKKDWFRDEGVDKNSKPVIRGRDIFLYGLKWAGRYIQYGDWLWCPRNKKFFENEKLFFRQTADRLIGTYEHKSIYCIDSVHSIINQSNNGLNLKYILAILNSKFGNFLYNLLISEVGKVFAQVKLTFLRQIPIKVASQKNQKPLIEIVDKILAITKDNDYLESPSKQAKVHECEKQIDQMVYKLYGLTKEEIKIVEKEK